MTCASAAQSSRWIHCPARPLPSNGSKKKWSNAAQIPDKQQCCVKASLIDLSRGDIDLTKKNISRGIKSETYKMLVIVAMLFGPLTVLSFTKFSFDAIKLGLFRSHDAYYIPYVGTDVERRVVLIMFGCMIIGLIMLYDLSFENLVYKYGLLLITLALACYVFLL